MALARSGRSDQTEVLLGPDPLEAGQVVEGRLFDRRGGDVELVEGLGHREGGGLQPVARALEASREAISASMRVRKNSSGFQRWVLAVTSSSGESARMAERRSRRSPASRSAASGGGVGAHDSLPDGVVRQRTDRDERAARR